MHHLRLGWWGLFAFALLGLALEAMHGLKLGAYLDVGNETRRLMWRLAHAHGVLLSLVHIAFASSLSLAQQAGSRGPRGRAAGWASRGLLLASLLIPIGFLLGGATIHGGDPGLGIALVPVGAFALLAALLLVAISLSRGPGP